MKLIYDTALRLVGCPYVYGGDTPMGLDCSGLVQILLAVGGADLPGDQTAHNLFDYFSQPENYLSREPQLGALIFFGNPRKKIHHVGMCLDRRRMIEAGGGGEHIKTVQDAIQARAFVRIVPLRFKDLAGIFMPEYPCCEMP